jgi:hypothetical protein
VRLYDQPVPDHSTLHDLERVIRPQTLHQFNARVLSLAQTYRITQGYKLRLDSRVTETNIRYPSDRGWRLDGVRVLSRLLERAAPLLAAEQRAHGWCSNHVRSARRRVRQIGQLTRVRAKEAQQARTSQVKKRL